MLDHRGKRRIHLRNIYTFSCDQSSLQTEESFPIGGPGIFFFRVVYCNELEKHLEKPYRSNYVSTTKYDFLTFFPKTLSV
jgi:phospholipid-translocating ATPase